jgi:hypothetical protein
MTTKVSFKLLSHDLVLELIRQTFRARWMFFFIHVVDIASYVMFSHLHKQISAKGVAYHHRGRYDGYVALPV